MTQWIQFFPTSQGYWKYEKGRILTILINSETEWGNQGHRMDSDTCLTEVFTVQIGFPHKDSVGHNLS